MDTTKLKIGDDVFIRHGGCFGWGKVIELLLDGEVVVETDPRYGAQLITFGKDRNSINKPGRRLYRDPLDASIVMRDGKYIPGSDGIAFRTERGNDYIRFTKG